MAAPSHASIVAPLIHEYLIEEDEMGDSGAQSFLLAYLEAVLEWLYRPAGWYVARNLSLSHPALRNSQQMISPDIAVFLGIPLTREEGRRLPSWDMRPPQKGKARRAGGDGAVRPCPPVVLEVSSGSTWQTDIGPEEEDKPQLYGRIGVREYFAYDPQEPPVWRGQGGRRLLGWRYDAQGRPEAVAPDARGWLWSAELDSWLGPDEALLRLYDPDGRLRLTAEEAQKRARQAEAEARREAEARAESERRAREAEEAARRQVEERLAALEAALRARDIDPEAL